MLVGDKPPGAYSCSSTVCLCFSVSASVSGKWKSIRNQSKGKRGMAPRMTLDTLAQIIAKACWASLSVPVSLALSASSVSFGPGALSPDPETSDRPERRRTGQAYSKTQMDAGGKPSTWFPPEAQCSSTAQIAILRFCKTPLFVGGLAGREVSSAVRCPRIPSQNCKPQNCKTHWFRTFRPMCVFNVFLINHCN